MERVKNKFYVAVSVLHFVFASICTLFSLTMIIPAILVDYSTALEMELVEESMEEYGTLSIEALEMAKTMIIGMIIFMVACSVVCFIAGAKFKKFSYMTNQEAKDYWGKSLAWVVVSYIFAGVLVGGLATAGLCVVQAKQKNGEVSADWTTSTGKKVDIETGNVEEDDALSTENLEKIRVRLEKLKELKDAGAITEEEFISLRENTVASIKPKKEEVKISHEEEKMNKMTERLNKLNSLKEAGAISEEEYNNLREKVINDNN